MFFFSSSFNILSLLSSTLIIFLLLLLFIISSKLSSINSKKLKYIHWLEGLYNPIYFIISSETTPPKKYVKGVK